MSTLKELADSLTADAKYPSFGKYLRSNYKAFAAVLERGAADKWDKAAVWAHANGYTGGRAISASAIKRSYERETARRRDAAQVPAGRVHTPKPAPAPVRPADQAANLPLDIPPPVVRVLTDDEPTVPAALGAGSGCRPVSATGRTEANRAVHHRIFQGDAEDGAMTEDGHMPYTIGFAPGLQDAFAGMKP
jgi:hypothetical protein